MVMSTAQRLTLFSIDWYPRAKQQPGGEVIAMQGYDKAHRYKPA